MNVTIYGSGYVGLVTGACLADVGNNVLCVDIDEEKINRLNQGEIPIFEPGLSDLIASAFEMGTINFTSDMQQAVDHAKIQFIAVGTPPDEDGSADTSAVLSVANTIGSLMHETKVIVDKSTVPVGTGDLVDAVVRSQLHERQVTHDVHVVSNPEFLKEGAAIADFMKPDRIVIGSLTGKAIELMRKLYAPFCRQRDRIIVMDRRSAELTKYAANAMLATKISFMNELSQIAEKMDANIELVRKGIGSDPRIGYHFIYPGIGYGGSCFPKDVKALRQTALDIGVEPFVLSAVEKRNEEQKRVLFNKVNQHYDGRLDGKTAAIWGLAFKPNTDDMREAPSRILMQQLWDAGVTVHVYDPEALDECRRIYGVRDDLVYFDNHMEALVDVDMLLICTEWKVFRSPDFKAVAASVRDKIVFDGRNLYQPELLTEAGLQYQSIGRPEA